MHQNTAVPSKTDPLVTVEGLGLTRDQRQILQDISFTISSGEIISVIGPNGAGKSSLIKCIVGLWRPSSGHLRVSPGIQFGYMPQSLHIDPSLPLTVKRFLALGYPQLKPQKSKTEQQQDIAQMLGEVGVGALIDAQLTDLSGGERQRVLLARALLRRPQLLVLDEPAQGVDLIGQAELYQLIARIRDQYQCAVLLVSHDLSLVMAKTDNVLCLNQHICCYGTPQTVGKDPSFIRLFGKIPEIALYAHTHDHHHEVDGSVVHQHGACKQGSSDHE